MGIPYSKEINHAFVELNKVYGQVTPLVAAAYEVLETTKNISLLVAGVQVMNSLLLATILVTMWGLLITMNPDLEKERKELVTPAVLWIAGWASIGKRVISTGVFLIVLLVIGGVMMMRREGRGPVESVELGEVEGEDQDDGVEEKEKDKEKEK